MYCVRVKEFFQENSVLPTFLILLQMHYILPHKWLNLTSIIQL